MTTSTTGTRRSGVAWLTVALAVYVGSVVVLALAGVPAGVAVAAAVVQAVMFGSGAAIALRSDVPRIGWKLVATGSTLNYWVSLGDLPLDGAAGLAASVAPLSVLPFMLVIATFPNASPTTGLGRFVVRFAIGVGTTSVLLMVAEQLDVIGGDWDAYRRLYDVVVIVVVLGTVANQVLTYRHRPRVEQLQVKYFALLMAVAQFQLYADWLGAPGADVFDALMPGAISVTILLAITRYRLYDIDRLISRTLAYSLVVATLPAVFVGGVAVVTSLLPAQDRLAVVLTTLAVLALFDPLRRRVTVAVDRRFDRTRYIARQVVDEFGRDVRDVTDLDEVVERVHAVAGATLAPATVAVWQPAEGRRP